MPASPAPSPPPTIPSISNPNTTTTFLPSSANNLISPTQSDRPILSFISNPDSTTTSLPSSPNILISPTQSDSPILSFIPSPDLELGNQPSPVPIPDNTDIDIDNVAQTAGFGGIGFSITLLVNTPSSATTHPALYMAYILFVCLVFATSFCIVAYLTFKKGSAGVGLVQKKLIWFTLFFAAMVFFVRLQIELPPIALVFVMVQALISMLVIAFYLFLCSRASARHTRQVALVCLPC